ncbi:MAG TPA: hypothetical protein VGF42_04035 [Caulobacteraceae bacterium]|jgi:hypothetical protein
MNGDAQDEAADNPGPGAGGNPFLIGLIVSYALAVISWVTMSPPWNLIPDSLAPLLDGPQTGIIAWVALASWIAVVAFAFWRFRGKAWPILLGAPLALYLPLQIFLTAVFCATGLGCP